MDTDGSNIPISVTNAGSPVFWLIVLFVVFVVIGGYFGSTESGISALNRIRIKSKAEDGDKKAKNAWYVVSHFDKALTTLLIGNNITHIAAASVATLIATRLFGASDTVTLLTTVVTTFIVFFFSEMIPKSFANDRPDTVAMAFSGFLRFLMKILTPVSWFFTKISDTASKLSDRLFKTTETPSITEDELYDIIDTIEEEGVMNEEQADLFESALDFAATEAKDVMTMREDILAIAVDTPNDVIAEIIKKTGHSRLPVFKDDLNHIVGILRTRRFIRAYVKDKNVKIRSLLLPAFHVSPQAKIDDLLSEMRQHKFYLGVVSDQNGQTLGLVSIEDFLEELVGEIWDEDDIYDETFIKLGGNAFRVDVRLTMSDVARRMKKPLPKSIDGALTVKDFIGHGFNENVEEDDETLIGNIIATADEVVDGQITHVILHPLNKEELTAYRSKTEVAQ